MLNSRGASRDPKKFVAATFMMICLPAASAPDGQPAATVQVVYAAPEKFTDVGDNSRVTTDKRRDAILAQLKVHLEQRAARYIPPGSSLTVTVTDIDMAGGFEPLRGPRLDHVRILRDVYPPRIKLEFTLAGTHGRVFKNGRRELSDLAYLMNVEYRNDLMRHEKKLLDDWLVREFQGTGS